MVIYEALFLKHEFEGLLEHQVEKQHVTTAFRPETAHAALYGQKATFRVVGYGNNGINEGFLVKLESCDSDTLRNLISKVKVPHITLSVSDGGRPVDTARLTFESVDGPLVETVFGGFMEGGEIKDS